MGELRGSALKNQWKQSDALKFIGKYGPDRGEELALLAYATRLVGGDPELAMHGGGNTSCKGIFKKASGEEVPALFIKPSGADMGRVLPADFIAMELDYLKELRSLSFLRDDAAAAQFRQHMLQESVFSPSIETPMHAFLDKKCIVHTHPSAILALSNRTDGQKTVAEALGDEAGFVPYASLGFNLGRAVAAEMTVKKDPPAIVLAQHGLVVWGETLREAYEKTIQYVTRAEDYLKEKTAPIFPARGKTSLHTASRLFNQCVPMLKELLSQKAETTDDAAGQEVVLSHLATGKLLALLDSPCAEEIFCSAPLNPDHLLRIKIRPVYLENPPYDDPEHLRRLVAHEIQSYKDDYARYIERHAGQLQGLTPPAEEFLPRALIFPGMGVVTAAKDAVTADIYRDIIRQAMHVKSVIHETGGTYAGLLEDDAFEMESRIWKKAAAVDPKV